MHRFDTDQRDGFGLLSERTICSAAKKSQFAYLEAKGNTGYFVFPARKSTKNYPEVAVEFVAAGPVFGTGQPSAWCFQLASLRKITGRSLLNL